MNRKLRKVKGPVGFQTEGPLILDLGMKESRNAQAQECEGICLNRVGCASVGGGALSQKAVDARERRTTAASPPPGPGSHRAGGATPGNLPAPARPRDLAPGLGEACPAPRPARAHARGSGR